jgi:hypothetical protein
MEASHLTSEVFSANGDAAVDRRLRNHKLGHLHRALARNVPGYVGMYEAGSTTARDPWVAGRSDRDITIVFSGQVRARLERELRRQLPALGFNDTYGFTAIPKGRFLATRHDNDISMKFRGRVLFGEDLIRHKQMPSRALAHQIAQDGLRALRGKFGHCLLNAESWSLELLRDKLYEAFKLFLMYLAADAYAETGRYPKRRIDVARAYGSGELLHIARVVAKVDSTEKVELLSTARIARDLLKDFLVSVP